MEPSIFSIPNTILMEILSKLPISTICNFKCVCSYFRNLISDPQFAQLHLSTPSQPSLLLSSNDSRDSSLYLVELIDTCDAESDIDDNICTPSNTLLKFFPDCDGPAEGFEVLSSCNGLICFYWPRTYNPYAICNPVINEYVIVPQTEKGYLCGSGFGFCPGTHQYKVLRILHPITWFYVPGLGEVKLEAEINTLGTNLWRRVGDAPRYLHSCSGGCFLNGALHWIVTENCSELMCCFNFEKENFQQFPGPSQFRGWKKFHAQRSDGALHILHPKLPISTICNFKCVCSYFRSLISDPEFAQLHLSTPSQPSLLLSSNNYWDYCVHLVESIDPCAVGSSGVNDDIRIPSNTLSNFYPQCVLSTEGLEVLSSCNGLICFYCPRTYKPYVICNPVIDEYVTVAQTDSVIVPQIIDKACLCGAGFGFCPGTNQYKVLRFLSPSIRFREPGVIKLEAEINTLGTNLWRRVGDAPRYLHSYYGGCFSNGALHWIVTENCTESMCCFDFGKENFQPFPGPSQFRGLAGRMGADAMILGELKGGLSLCHRPSDDDTLDIWVMKDYAVQESWAKDFVIKILWVEAINRNYHYRPLMVLNNEDILMLGDSSLLLSWNIRDRSFRWVNGLPSFSIAIPYIQSFVSIKNVA